MIIGIFLKKNYGERCKQKRSKYVVPTRLQRRTAFFPFVTAEVDVQGLIGDDFLTTYIFQKDDVAKIEGVAWIAEAALIGEEGKSC